MQPPNHCQTRPMGVVRNNYGARPATLGNGFVGEPVRYGISSFRFLAMQIFQAFQEMKLNNMTQSVFIAAIYCEYLSLKEGLSNCGLVLSSSERDGNSFFTSVAKNMCNHPDIWASKLRQLGIEHVEMSHILVTKLRQIFVAELTGEREHQYRDFVITGKRQKRMDSTTVKSEISCHWLWLSHLKRIFYYSGWITISLLFYSPININSSHNISRLSSSWFRSLRCSPRLSNSTSHQLYQANQVQLFSNPCSVTHVNKELTHSVN
jgi:hypothetical protein